MDYKKHLWSRDLLFSPNYFDIQTKISRDVRTLDRRSCRKVRFRRIVSISHFDENNYWWLLFSFLLVIPDTQPSTRKSMHQTPAIHCISNVIKKNKKSHHHANVAWIGGTRPTLKISAKQWPCMIRATEMSIVHSSQVHVYKLPKNIFSSRGFAGSTTSLDFIEA